MDSDAPPEPQRTGPSVALRLLLPEHAPQLTRLRTENAEFFRPFEPAREPAWYSPERTHEDLSLFARLRAAQMAYRFGIFPAGVDDDELVGTISLSCIERGAWQNCNVGYSVAQRCNGRGYATEAVGLAVDIAFSDLALHRVQAAVMPRNARSARVLERNGFRREGRATRYLQLNGAWEDHDIYAVTNDG
jgi:ribosomal-protein-alanine N-acetyltransferase